MGKTLKSEIIAFLGKESCCKFKLIGHHRGNVFELEYNGKKNEDCGDIYDKLDYWFTDSVFCEYLAERGCFYNCEGFICVDDKEEINIKVSFLGPNEDFVEPVYLYLDESFLINNLGLNLSELGINNFDNKYLSINFLIEKGAFISKISLVYEQKKPIKIKLNAEQQSILKKYVLDFVMKNAPTLLINFECDEIIDAECYDNEVTYKVSTSLINIKWSDVYPE
jgi:hypothetical protein